MTTLRPHNGTGRVILPGPERMQDFRELMTRASDPQLPGVAVQPFQQRRSSVGQVALVAVPTVAVLVGSALAVGSVTRGSEPAPAPQPSTISPRSLALPAPGPAAVAARAHQDVIPVVLTRETAGQLAGSAFARYAYTLRAGAPPASGGTTILTGGRTATPPPSVPVTHQSQHGDWSGGWYHGTGPPADGGWSAAPVLGKGTGAQTSL